MITLPEYLKICDTDGNLAELITLIVAQAVPIRDAFISNQDCADSKNSSGETQTKMDTWSDKHIINILEKSKMVRQVASEEHDDIVQLNKAAKYSVVMDPLDGSSLVKANLCVGTIIGIYEGNCLQAGKNLKAAFYILYGPMTTVTVTVGNGVAVFVLNKNGEYQMLKNNIKIPEGNLYGSGGIRTEWLGKHAKFINRIENEGAKIRYSGAFVADFHQILQYGGIYAYPPSEKQPDGKLRLVFEVNPIGFLAEQAGGAVSNGETSTLEIVPTKLHQRTVVYVGSYGMITKIENTQ
ncbi:MAG TPA: fructose-1,6-bisphosphatase [Methanocorpusculum sp.]|nr:fructose-1,6-bisphosphatase [Methanocorpusculum sp.]